MIRGGRPSVDTAPDRYYSAADAVERTLHCGESCGSQRL